MIQKEALKIGPDGWWWMGNSKQPYLTKGELLKDNHEFDVMRLWNSEVRKLTPHNPESFGLSINLSTWCIDLVSFGPTMGTIQ